MVNLHLKRLTLARQKGQATGREGEQSFLPTGSLLWAMPSAWLPLPTKPVGTPLSHNQKIKPTHVDVFAPDEGHGVNAGSLGQE